MIRVGALHEALQQRRREQQSLEFKLRMRQRNGIEGTISELVRAHGMRRARYRGFAKVDLQNQLIAAACNIKRWLAKLGAVAVAPFKRDSQTHLAPEGLPAAMGLAITRILARISKKLIVLATPKLA
jgi:DDE family transposase